MKKKTKTTTHRQQSTKIGSGRNVSGSNGNDNDNGDNNDGNGDSGNDDNNDGSGGGRRATAAANGMVWGRHHVAGGSGNRNKAEIGTMWVQ